MRLCSSVDSVAHRHVQKLVGKIQRHRCRLKCVSLITRLLLDTHQTHSVSLNDLKDINHEKNARKMFTVR